MAALILIVDDDEDTRELAASLLGHFGYRTMVAPGGRAALEVARRQPPDLIMMDLSMPIMNGFEAIRHLKADPRTAPIPVIALSAYDSADDKEAARAAGCAAYLSKPLNIAMMQQTIESAMGGATPPAAD